MLNNIKLITDNDLCISCGACTHICPFNNIVMEFKTYKGKWDADIKSLGTCQKCNGEKNCLSVCPNYIVDYVQLAQSYNNNLLGKVASVYTGYSKNFTVRYNSSSGGFIRELCQTLLSNQEVDGIISIVHQRNLEYRPEIITDISKMPNSVYHNINFENTINLLRNNKGRYAIIGLPCQITSLELILRKKVFMDINERVHAKISLICGYSFERINMEAFSYYNGFKLKEITYRENGRFRKTRIYDNEKSLMFEVYKPKNFNERINNSIMMDRFLCQKGCLYCVDHIGYCADIVVGDAWLERYIQDDVGTNIIISRTPKGQEMISKIVNFGFEKGTLNDIVESQGSEYALGSIGEAFKRINRSDKVFIPRHKRGENNQSVLVYKYDLFDLFIAKVLKVWLRKRLYTLVKMVYTILQLILTVKSIVLKKLGY